MLIDDVRVAFSRTGNAIRTIFDQLRGLRTDVNTSRTETVIPARLPGFFGDATVPFASNAITLANVNVNIGAFGNATHVGTFTVNAKGLTTASGVALITPAWGSVTGKPTTLAGYSVTATDVLNTLLTVDGAGSGLDADFLDGQSGAFYQNAANLNAGTIPFARLPALIGDVSLPIGNNTLTLATVNSNIGAFGNATHVGTFTVNAKGLTTAAGMALITPDWSSVTGKPTTLAGYSVTATDVLNTLLTVDGTGSGLDADLLDGQTGTFYQNATNINAGTLATARLPALIGDVSLPIGNNTLTLATVNSNVGTFGNATHTMASTVNAKGLTTAVTPVLITPNWTSITNRPTTIAGYGITDTYDFITEIRAFDDLSCYFAPVALDFTTGMSRWAQNYYEIPSLASWSFSRTDTSCIATSFRNDGTIQRFSSGVPRITDRGLLVEESRTNLLLNSIFAGGGAAPTSWTQPGASGTSAPAASTINPGVVAYSQSATAQRPFLSQTINVAANSTYQFYFFVEAVTGGLVAQDLIFLTGSPAGSTVSFVACSANPTGAFNGTVVPGILQMQLVTAGTAGTVQCRAGLGCSSNITGTVRFSTPQAELGTYATSPIITTNAVGTRGADVPIISYSMPSAYTIFAEIEKGPNVNNGTILEGNNISGFTFAYTGDGARIRILNRHGSVRTDSNSGSSATIVTGQVMRIVTTSEGNMSANGVTQPSLAVAPQADFQDSIRLGHRSSTVGSFNGYIRRVSFHPYALSATQINDITK